MCERLWVRTCVRFSGDCDSACRSAGLLVVCDICGSGCPQQEQTNPLLPAAPGVTLTCEYTHIDPKPANSNDTQNISAQRKYPWDERSHKASSPFTLFYFRNSLNMGTQTHSMNK